jgi:hypothetical protein
MSRVFMNQDKPLADYEIKDIKEIVDRESERSQTGQWQGRPWPDHDAPWRLPQIYRMTTEQLVVICRALLLDVERCRIEHQPAKKKKAKASK